MMFGGSYNSYALRAQIRVRMRNLKIFLQIRILYIGIFLCTKNQLKI